MPIVSGETTETWILHSKKLVSIRFSNLAYYELISKTRPKNKVTVNGFLSINYRFTTSAKIFTPWTDEFKNSYYSKLTRNEFLFGNYPFPNIIPALPCPALPLMRVNRFNQRNFTSEQFENSLISLWKLLFNYASSLSWTIN